jgi:hypothetical protein
MSYPPPPADGGDLGPGAGQSTSASGFFGALFDFSFHEFITPKVVKFVYVLSTIGLLLAYAIFVIAGFSRSAGGGIAILILGAIAVIIYLALIRMTLEFYLAIVRMSEDIHRRLPQR